MTWKLSGRVKTLRPRQKGHFPDDIFKCIFLAENILISMKISLNFVPRGSINNTPVLAQIMAWRRSGDKPLSEPTMVSLLTHICVTRPQWVNHKLYIQAIRARELHLHREYPIKKSGVMNLVIRALKHPMHGTSHKTIFSSQGICIMIIMDYILYMKNIFRWYKINILCYCPSFWFICLSRCPSDKQNRPTQ